MATALFRDGSFKLCGGGLDGGNSVGWPFGGEVTPSGGGMVPVDAGATSSGLFGCFWSELQARHDAEMARAIKLILAGEKRRDMVLPFVGAARNASSMPRAPFSEVASPGAPLQRDTVCHEKDAMTGS
jgi:hypothetical protein